MNLKLVSQLPVVDGVALVMLSDQMKACEEILKRAVLVEFRFCYRPEAGAPWSLAFVWRKFGREHGTAVFGLGIVDALAQACQVLEAEFPNV